MCVGSCTLTSLKQYNVTLEHIQSHCDSIILSVIEDVLQNVQVLANLNITTMLRRNHGFSDGEGTRRKSGRPKLFLANWKKNACKWKTMPQRINPPIICVFFQGSNWRMEGMDAGYVCLVSLDAPSSRWYNFSFNLSMVTFNTIAKSGKCPQV